MFFDMMIIPTNAQLLIYVVVDKHIIFVQSRPARDAWIETDKNGSTRLAAHQLHIPYTRGDEPRPHYLCLRASLMQLQVV